MGNRIRKCGMCKIEKELSVENYQKDRSRLLGFMYNCKPCEKMRSREKYLKNPRLGRYANFNTEEKRRKYETGKIYAKTLKGRAIFLQNAYLKFDKKRGYESNLTQNDLINVFSLNCSYCGHAATGFDRIDNSKGHTTENCIPCCKDCNVARMDNFTHEEMKIIGSAIKEVKDLRLNAL